MKPMRRCKRCKWYHSCLIDVQHGGSWFCSSVENSMNNKKGIIRKIYDFLKS